MKRFLFLLLSICLIGSKTFAQQYLQFTFPFERMVFQREFTNQANVYFSAQYTNPNSNSFGYTAQYRIQPLSLQSGNASGSPTAWTNIGFNNTAGIYRTVFGNIPNLNSGWYQLQIRMIDGDGVQKAINYRKFGVGDIFVIAGQSNSQGYAGIELNPDSNDPNIISYYNGNAYSNGALPDAVNISPFSVVSSDGIVPTRAGTRVTSISGFTKLLQKDTINIPRQAITIFPNGTDSWCYAVLGKDMQATTQVPIAFFNAGASGSDVENWAESIPQNTNTKGLTHFRFARDNQGIGCIYDPQNPDYCSSDMFGNYPTTPYTPFRNTLQMFNSIMGIRAVLWHQGETDAERKRPDTYPSQDFSYYQNALQTLIQQSRLDFKDENNNSQTSLSWFISKVSFWRSYPDNPMSTNPNWNDQITSNLIPKQVAVAGQGNNHLGADTDGIGMQSSPSVNDSTRSQGSFNVHFSNKGLKLISDKWLASQPWQGNPIKGKPLLPITITQVSGGLYNLTAPLQANGQPYAKYFWVKDGTSLTNYIGDSQTLENVNLYAGSLTCYVSKSADSNEMNFFACQPVYMGLPNLGSPPCPTFLTYDSPNDDFSTTPSPIDQKANNVINATNAIKNNGTTVNYKAGKAMILENGFKADASTVFKAEIIGCDNVPVQTWFSDNVGSGSGSSLLSGVLSINGNGSLGGTNDNIHYYHSTYSGDVNIIAKIEGISTTDGHRAGIMIRNSIADNSGFYEFIIDGNGNVGKLKRKNTGDGAGFYGYAQCPTSGSWIKIEKTGNTIKCYFKPDDTYNWLEVIGWDDHTDNNFNSSFQIGFVAYSGATATFINITVNGTPVN